MLTYPYTPSQVSTATATDLLAFIKSPTLLARRLGEILNAQQFIGNFLLSGRYTMQGGAIAIPVNEQIRTPRRSERVAPGAEYKLTPLTREQYELYTAQKQGIGTEITDEEIVRSLRRPLDDAFTFLHTELVFDANERALGVVQSSVTQEIEASAPWTNGKTIVRDALRVKARTRALKLGFDIDTCVLNGEQYATVLPELIDVVPDGQRSAILAGAFPTVGGITWVSSDDDEFSDPLFVDRRRLGGIAREDIPSPEYRPVGADTGVEITSIREPKADKTRLQARNTGIPIVVNPQAAFVVLGAGGES